MVPKQRILLEGHADKRRFERVPFFAEVAVSLPAGEHLIDARSIDISLSGIGLVCPMPLPVGMSVSVTVRLGSDERLIEEGPVVGRVVNLRLDDDAAIVGVEFTPVLSRSLAPGLVRTIEKL
jgi:hypothetical protein